MNKNVDVSRETIAELQDYCADVKQWNKTINLVSKSTVDDIWNRHIIDSLQVFGQADSFSHWMDLGSGGGFPGIVCAIAAKTLNPAAKFTLIESDVRKSAFLLKTSLKYKLNATVLPKRIETYSGLSCDVLSARALSALPVLLGYAEKYLSNDGMCLFPKGKTFESELSEARKQWSFDCDVIESSTSADAAILRIRNVSRTG